MCIFSACGQIVFGFIMGLCLILTAVATFDGKLLSWDCINQEHLCNPWQHAQRDHMIAVACALCLAIVFQVISCACCCKKYIIHPLVGLAFITTVFLFIGVIVYVVAQNESDGKHSLWQLNIKTSSILKGYLMIKNTSSIFVHGPFSGFINYRSNEYGYSFWLAVCALILAAMDTIVAGMTVCLGTRGL
ncbi:hypothetical protein COOONC_14358 [Cooperia oncophora]